MFDSDSWQEIFATIKKNKLRTALTCFGVFWGIFMLVVMIGSGNGLSNGILKDFAGTATNSFFCWAQKTSKPYKGMKPGRNFNFNNDDTKALKQLPELAVVAPMNQLGNYEGTNNVVRGLKNGGFEVSGVYPELRKIEATNIKAGRFLNQNDIDDKRKVAVIGKRVQEILFEKDENPIGEYIRVQGVYFRVVGVTEPASGGERGREAGEKVQIPFTTFQQAFNYGDIVGWYAIMASKGVPATKAEDMALALLRERHKVAPDDAIAIGHWNMEKEFNKLNGLFAGISGLVWIVGTGTLLAGIIGVSNIMLIVVKERTKEIGIRRAIGAPPGHIVRQLILESVFLTTIAGYVGLILSIALMEGVSSMLASDDSSMFTNPTIDLNVALTALAILIGAGALAGLIPARKAIAIPPVEALRYDN
ncbi:MAG: ABC transporter permease [Bacteroidia bacterium]|jgi:putative ABC transport system permease protein|nr:ABC transporter permease [Bacteroidia bacterium]